MVTNILLNQGEIRKTQSDIWLQANEFLVFCDASSNNISVFLPKVSAYPGLIYKIRKVDDSENTINIVSDDGDIIQGVDSLDSVTSNVELINDGVNCWYTTS